MSKKDTIKRINVRGMQSGVAGGGITIVRDIVHDVPMLDLAANFTWTGQHWFRATMTTKSIVPEAEAIYDLGAPTSFWRRLHVREIDTSLLPQGAASIISGQLVICRAAGSLPSAVLVEADAINFGQAMTPGDFVRFTTAAQSEYVQVGALIDGTTYNVTRGLGGTAAAYWPAGSVYEVLGPEGAGRVELVASPVVAMQVVRQGATADTKTRLVRLGDLQGQWGYPGGTEQYGLAVGEYATGKANLTWDEVNGLRLRTYDVTVLQLDNAGNASIAGWLGIGTAGGIYQGSGTPAAPNVGLKIYNSGGVGLLEAWGEDVGAPGTYIKQVYLDTSGKLYAGGGAISLDSRGIVVTGDSIQYILFQNGTTLLGGMSGGLTGDGLGGGVILQSAPGNSLYGIVFITAVDIAIPQSTRLTVTSENNMVYIDHGIFPIAPIPGLAVEGGIGVGILERVYPAMITLFNWATAPSITPAADRLYLYAHDRGGISSLYFMDDSGVEHDLLAGGSGGLVDHNHISASDGGVLSGDVHDTWSIYTEIPTPPAPIANQVFLYAKRRLDVSTLYWMGDDGVEHHLAFDQIQHSSLLGIGPNDHHLQVHADTDHSGPNRVRVTAAGGSVGDRPILNFIGDRPILNFIGTGVSTADDPANGRVNITINTAADAPAAAAARITNNADQAVASGSWLALTFNTPQYDSHGMYNPADPTLLTIQVGGKYAGQIQIAFSSNATGMRGVRVLRNATTIAHHVCPAVNGDFTYITLGLNDQFSAGDTLKAEVYQTSGTQLSVLYRSYSPILALWDTSLTEIEGGAPVGCSYIVEDADPTLPNERVLGTTVIRSDLWANRGAPAKAGRLLLPADAPYLVRDSGSELQTWGPLWRMKPPDLAGFSWVNQGTAAAGQNKGFIFLSGTATVGSSLRVLVKAAPAPPYKLTAYFLPFMVPFVSWNAGLCLRDSMSGKLVTFAVGVGQSGLGYSARRAYASTWNSPTSAAGSYGYVDLYCVGPQVPFFRIWDDGTNRQLQFSLDGQNFVTWLTQLRSDFCTPNQIGFFIDGNNATAHALGMSLLHWEVS